MNLGSELIDFPRHALYFRHKRCVLFDGITHLYTYIYIHTYTQIYTYYIYTYIHIYTRVVFFLMASRTRTSLSPNSRIISSTRDDSCFWRLLASQYLCFCTSKVSKVSACSSIWSARVRQSCSRIFS